MVFGMVLINVLISILAQNDLELVQNILYGPYSPFRAWLQLLYRPYGPFSMRLQLLYGVYGALLTRLQLLHGQYSLSLNPLTPPVWTVHSIYDLEIQRCWPKSKACSKGNCATYIPTAQTRNLYTENSIPNVYPTWPEPKTCIRNHRTLHLYPK